MNVGTLKCCFLLPIELIAPCLKALGFGFWLLASFWLLALGCGLWSWVKIQIHEKSPTRLRKWPKIEPTCQERTVSVWCVPFWLMTSFCLTGSGKCHVILIGNMVRDAPITFASYQDIPNPTSLQIFFKRTNFLSATTKVGNSDDTCSDCSENSSEPEHVCLSREYFLLEGYMSLSNKYRYDNCSITCSLIRHSFKIIISKQWQRWSKTSYPLC